MAGYVTKHSFALDLKVAPFQSAMSMLNFYINRAGKNLKPERKKVLEEAKDELRKLFREPKLASK